jgi:DNA-binding response OmpR family regulator
MANNPKILFVEDDKNLAYILTEYLMMNDFEVTWAKDGKEAFAHLQKNHFDMCILDIMLPQLDGFSVAEEIRTNNKNTPFIFLTAKSLKIDKLKGFKSGCDDYITKPVDEEELIARIRVVLKRASKDETASTSLKMGKTEFQVDAQRIVLPDKSDIQLTNKEAGVLHSLAVNKNKIVRTDIILKSLWGANDFFNRRSMDVIISRLRKHLKNDTSIIIKNVHSKGYILEEL